jgi:Family of unknown function (DUF6677)
LTAKTASARWHFAGAIAAWLVPGLGHLLLGQKGRALILMTSIGLLWLGGFFIGGVGVFDRKGHPIWFMGQMLIAPSVLVEGYHRSLQGPNGLPPRPDDPAGPYQPSYGHVHEQGVLYTSLAGMLNLLAIMDVLYRDPADPRHRYAPGRRPRPSEGSSGGTPEGSSDGSSGGLSRGIYGGISGGAAGGVSGGGGDGAAARAGGAL